jgi:plastocyanin
MSRFTTTLFLTIAVAAVSVGVAFAHGASTVHVTIRHQLHGCHAWSVDGGAYKASQRIAVAAGTKIQVTDDDVMPHKLYEVSGPRVAIRSLRAPASTAPGQMSHMGASAETTLTKAGTYVFGTKAGEDYMAGVKTIGEDNVLRLTVVVK